MKKTCRFLYLKLWMFKVSHFSRIPQKQKWKHVNYMICTLMLSCSWRWSSGRTKYFQSPCLPISFTKKNSIVFNNSSVCDNRNINRTLKKKNGLRAASTDEIMFWFAIILIVDKKKYSVTDSACGITDISFCFSLFLTQILSRHEKWTCTQV